MTRCRDVTKPLACPFCGNQELKIETQDSKDSYQTQWAYIRCGKCQMNPFASGNSACAYTGTDGWTLISWQTKEQAAAKAMEDATYKWNERPSTRCLQPKQEPPEFGTTWRNKKNGKLYMVVGTIRNANNSAGYNQMVKYMEKGDLDAEECGRDIPEFYAKFEEVK